MHEEKKYNPRCMYGNYLPNFDLESRNSFLDRLRAFFIQRRVSYQLRRKNRCTGLKRVSAGATLLILLLGIFVMQGCKPKQVIVEREKVVYVHSDSTIYKDSVVYVPVEVYKDYSRLTDTLLLETSLATAKAWNDTNAWIIKGYIKNKQAVQYKYIEVEKIVKNDSIVEREVPVPYEVEVVKTHIPTWAWLCLSACIIGLCLGGWRLYRKFFK